MKLSKRDLKFIFFSLLAMFAGFIAFWQYYFHPDMVLKSPAWGWFFAFLSLTLSFVVGFRFCQLDVEKQHLLKKNEDYQKRLEQMNKKFELTDRSFQSFLDSCHAFSTESHVHQICEKVMNILEKNMSADQASIMLLNESNKLYIESSVGIEDDVILSTELAMGERISGVAVQEQKDFLIVGDLEDYPFFQDLESHSQIQSAIICPILFKDKIYGVLNMSRIVETKLYTPQDLQKAKFLARQIGLAIYQLELTEQMKEKKIELEEAYQGIKESQVELISFYQDPAV